MAETTIPTAPRHGAFSTARQARRYWVLLGVLIVLSIAVCFGILSWSNPLPVGSEGFWRVAGLRANAIAVILVVTWCQAIATVAFQTITANRIITPSIMGFESLYRLVQTASVYFFGVAGLSVTDGPWQYVLQVGLMVLFAAILFGWLLTGERGNIHQTLLVGIIIGTGLGALSTYMARLLTPSEFDLLTARLIGNLSNADVSQLGLALPLAAGAGGALLLMSRRLDVLALGRGVATTLGLDHAQQSRRILLLTAVLMAVSTSLIGPMSFLGFLIAMGAYQLADTHEHRYVLPMAWCLGIVVLGGAYFTLRHIFYAQGTVGVIIEAVGGTFFLIHLLRKGRL